MECRLDYITKGDYMDIDDYLKYIDQLSDKFIFKLDAYNFDEPLKVDEKLVSEFMDFLDIKRQTITDSEEKTANFMRVKSILSMDLNNETKLILIAIYFDLISVIREKQFIMSFDSYNKEQPIFSNNDLFNYVRHCRELINYDALKWSKFGGICSYDDKFLVAGNYIKEEILEFVRDNCKGYKKYIRIHPYLSYDKFPPIYFKEAAQRPVDPNWIKKLELYKGQKTGGHYFLYPVEEINNEMGRLMYLEYSILGIRSLEIYAQRNNSGNLSMMIEEMREYKEHNKYFVSKCIHLDTDGDVGVKIDDAILNHIDLAINVYDSESYLKRKNQSLSEGRVVDATFRVHLLRLEDAPFKILINLAYLFFDSEVLTREWIFDQFQ